jgi:pimeloyl-ACP methyl ester carboxylesterase
MLQAEAQRLHRVVYILDQGGTGHSRPLLSCPELERVSTDGLTRTTGDPSVRQDLLEAVSQCRARLQASGVDPSDFDLTAMAADVEDLRRALGLASWNLAAYGTWSRLALEVIREYPDHVRATYLDSPQFPQLSEPTETALGTRLVLDELFSACRAQASCRTRYPGLRSQWRTAITRLDARPVEAQTPIGRVLVDGGAFVRGMVAVLEDDAELARFPELIASASRRHVDVDIATTLISQGSLCAGYRFDCLPHFSAGVYLSVLCSTDQAAFADPADWNDVGPRIPGVARTLETNPYVSACSAWKVPREAATVRAPGAGSVPVLLVSGEFDSFSPPALTRRLAHFKTSFPITVPGEIHNPLERNDCRTTRIRDQWLDHPSAPPSGISCPSGPELEFLTQPQA